MSLPTIGLGTADRGIEGQFVAENIFPESDLPRLGEIADASEGIFEIVSVRNDRADYKRTNHEFRDRLRKLGRGGQLGGRGNGFAVSINISASRLPTSAAERRTFTELPFGGLPTRVSISLCELEHAGIRFSDTYRSGGAPAGNRTRITVRCKQHKDQQIFPHRYKRFVRHFAPLVVENYDFAADSATNLPQIVETHLSEVALHRGNCRSHPR